MTKRPAPSLEAWRVMFALVRARTVMSTTRLPLFRRRPTPRMLEAGVTIDFHLARGRSPARKPGSIALGRCEQRNMTWRTGQREPVLVRR